MTSWNDAPGGKKLPDSMNSALSTVEEDFFRLSDTEDNASLQSETEKQSKGHNNSERSVGDADIVSVTADIHGVSPSKRGKDKTARPERRLKKVSSQQGKVANKPTNKEGTKNAPKSSKANKPARCENGGKNAATSAAQTANLTQLSDILQSSLSTAFAGLAESMKTGFADIGKLIHDTTLFADSAARSEDISGDEDSDDTEEPPAKRQKTAEPRPAIIEKLTKGLALEDDTGPNINTQLAGLVNKLLREAKPNETKLNELKKLYIPPNNCEGLSETKVNTNIWNNLGETARSNDLKLQKVQKHLVK